ncbi:MAG TPA: rhomboid family intramembrane serine protease [Methylococcaceae bacterium]|jgi:membrane associated rhomboid family serine protease|nr:rhomboid family intramembrane serine protease [Methylococcaceae bacterium]HIB62018.1 rhomboid family intramembrane serine protease [Methylococcaceae bacterium]HIN67748.1 rhomboid family intramembrane serine protease [Methylococcales bacterium]HIO13126.1 rhomboid family intramembrane serine protease [Methylococcales bacterium]
MIPVRNTIPLTVRPYITWGLIFINTAIFSTLFILPVEVNNYVLYIYGMVAARYSFPEWALKTGFPDDSYFSFFSSMFLHGDVLHLLINLVFLWIFAGNIEARMGRVRFFLFYVLCGLFAAFLQYYFNSSATLPMVGASGAIAGVLGAFFLLYPYARIKLWLPLFFLPIFVEVPAVGFLGLWVMYQIHEATIGLVTQEATLSTVAWWTHVGGFIAGLLIHPFFLKQEHPPLLTEE